MKGLLYKDFCMLRRSLWSMLILVAVFCLVPEDTFFNLGLFFVIYTGLLPASLLSFDERSKWDKLAPMLPVTRREIVRSKYVMGFYLTLAAGALFFLGRAAVARVAAPKAAAMALSATAVGLLFQSVLYPFLFRLGVEKGRLAMGGVTAVMVFLCVSGGLFTTRAAAVDQVMTAGSAPVFFALAVVAELVSIRVAERQYARREG